MPIVSSADPTKVLDLNTRAIAGESLKLAQIIAAYWPDGTKYYTCRPLDKDPDYKQLTLSPIEMRVPLSSSATPNEQGGGKYFLDLPLDSDIADVNVEVLLDDTDQATDGSAILGIISDKFFQFGAGVRFEVFYYFPQVDLTLSLFHGHLRAPKMCDGFFFISELASGFRSPLLPLPAHAHYPRCTAQFRDKNCGYTGSGGEGLAGFVDCSKSLAACQARFPGVTNIPYLGTDTIYQAYATVNNFGPHTIAVTKGNETNLKLPIRVIFGTRTIRQLDVLETSVETNPDHPERGSIRILCEVSEGPIASITLVQASGGYVPFSGLQTRLGTRRQMPTTFNAAGPTPNYSKRAHFFAQIKGDFRTTDVSSLNLSCVVTGQTEVPVYTDPNTFTLQAPAESAGQRAWALLECYCNILWGRGENPARFEINDFIYLATWGSQLVGTTDSSGSVTQTIRSTFNCDVISRTAQDNIRDICLWGRIGMPFVFEGKIRVIPLERVDTSNLSQIPTFTDIGPNQNIVVDEAGHSTTKWWVIDEETTPNQVVVNFEDAEHDNTERPLLFVDEPAQLAAAAAAGDINPRVIEKQYSAFGVVHFGEASRLGNLILDLGEDDSGGLKNPVGISFTTHFTETIGLHKYKVIRVLSYKYAAMVRKYNFTFFRIMSIHYNANLTADIICQAYPEAYYDALENNTIPPPRIGQGGTINLGGGGGSGPFTIGIDPFKTFQLGPDSVFIQLLGAG